MFNETIELLESKEKEKQEEAVRSAQILSEFLKSYALFGFLEYLYRTSMAVIALVALIQIMRIPPRQKEPKS